MITVTFEDNGQDFLEWDIENGVVTGCRPFQGSVWGGARVSNKTFKVGGFVRVTIKGGTTLTVKYPLTSVVNTNKKKRNRK